MDHCLNHGPEKYFPQFYLVNNPGNVWRLGSDCYIQTRLHTKKEAFVLC